MPKDRKERCIKARVWPGIPGMVLVVLLMLQSPVWGEFLVDEAKGVVTDTATGLMWERMTGNNGEDLTWEGAVTYCEQLQLAGYDDWRLPDSSELQSIIDYMSYNPAVDRRIFPGTEASGYWSSTTYAPNPDYAWRIDFYYLSYMNISKKTNHYYVRAVRTLP